MNADDLDLLFISLVIITIVFLIWKASNLLAAFIIKFIQKKIAFI